MLENAFINSKYFEIISEVINTVNKGGGIILSSVLPDANLNRDNVEIIVCNLQLMQVFSCVESMVSILMGKTKESPETLKKLIEISEIFQSIRASNISCEILEDSCQTVN